MTLYSSRLSAYTADHLRLLKEAAALLGAALSSNAEAALPEMQQPAQAAEAASLDEYQRRVPLHVALVESELKH